MAIAAATSYAAIQIGIPDDGSGSGWGHAITAMQIGSNFVETGGGGGGGSSGGRGGMVANGAQQTGAFGYLFNDLAREATAPRPIDWGGIGRSIWSGVRSLGIRANVFLSALSLSGDTPLRTYRHYGYASNAASFSDGLAPGSYATDSVGLPMSGIVAQDRLALPHAIPPDAYYSVTPPRGTPVIGPSPVQPTLVPPRGSGGIEYTFPQGTPPGSVTGPFAIP